MLMLLAQDHILVHVISIVDLLAMIIYFRGCLGEIKQIFRLSHSIQMIYIYTRRIDVS